MPNHSVLQRLHRGSGTGWREEALTAPAPDRSQSESHCATPGTPSPAALRGGHAEQPRPTAAPLRRTAPAYGLARNDGIGPQDATGGISVLHLRATTGPARTGPPRPQTPPQAPRARPSPLNGCSIGRILQIPQIIHAAKGVCAEYLEPTRLKRPRFDWTFCPRPR